MVARKVTEHAFDVAAVWSNGMRETKASMRIFSGALSHETASGLRERGRDQREVAEK